MRAVACLAVAVTSNTLPTFLTTSSLLISEKGSFFVYKLIALYENIMYKTRKETLRIVYYCNLDFLHSFLYIVSYRASNETTKVNSLFRNKQ